MPNLLELPREIRDVILEYALITARAAPSDIELVNRLPDPAATSWIQGQFNTTSEGSLIAYPWDDFVWEKCLRKGFQILPWPRRQIIRTARCMAT
jgi:hypothetical protein